MQNKSELFESILSSRAYTVVSKAIIDGVEYPEGSGFVSAAVSGSLFAEKRPSVGSCVSRQVDIIIRNPANFSRMAKIQLFSRVEQGEQTSEWIPKGVFYIDTRQTDDVSGALSLHGYDAMLKASPNYIDVDEDSGSWPRKCRIVVEDIAFRMGVELDERTVLQDYDVGYMPLTSGREILGWIAAMHGGNWTITDEGKLRLVPLVPSGNGIDLGREMAKLETAPEFAPYTGVQFYYEDKDTIFAGTDEGRVLEVECPWATQEIANAVLEQVRGYVYRPYEAAGAILDPAAELGDPITVSGTDSVLASCDTTFNALLVSDIAAPEDEEIDHEYPYVDPNRNRTRREIARAKADINIGVDSIKATVEGVNRELAELDLEVGSIRMEVSDPSIDGYVTLSLIVGGETKSTGLIKIDGNVDISGSLSAGELYAALGDIAQLTVDSLSTARKIPQYLAKDTSDINYVDIRDRRIALVRAWTDGSTEQAKNPNGQLLFWETDISDARIGEDGYPYINNTRVFTTTENTGHEVWIYKYQQGDRWVQTFDTGGNYGPRQVWGEGDGTSSGKGRGYIEKLGLSFDVYNLGTDNVKRGMFMGDDFTSITGLRRPTAITEDGDTIVVEMEGKVTETFTRSFDAAGGLLGVADQDGFYTAMTNPVFLPLAMMPRLMSRRSEPKRPLQDYAWDEISAISTSGKAASKFALGDTKDIVLTTGEVVTMRIIGFGHDDLADGSGKAGITFEMQNCLATAYSMDGSNTNINGWSGSGLRSKLVDGGEINSTLPSEVLTVIRKITKSTSKGNQSAELQTTEESIFLLSEAEILGEVAYSAEGEGVQYDYYRDVSTSAESRVKRLSNGTGDVTWWWTRSPYLYNPVNFVPIVAGGTPGWVTAGSYGGVSFAFCV